MAGLTAKQVKGLWTGRLIDVRGYEGEFSLVLKSRSGSVSGTIEAAIGATHVSQRQRVPVRGKIGDDPVVRLEGVVDEKAGVEIALELEIFDLVGEGNGMRGTYRVVARSFSPLRAGVVAASKDRSIPAQEVRPQREMPRHGQTKVRAS